MREVIHVYKEDEGWRMKVGGRRMNC
jgi:hypothetical protein